MTWEGLPVPGEADVVRVVIDEASFDFRELAAGELDGFLDEVSDTLAVLRKEEISPWKPPQFAETECLDGRGLYSHLLDAAERDVMLRFISLADKCLEWDVAFPRGDVAVISGKEALSVSFAAAAAASGHAVACLVFPAMSRRGFQDVEYSEGAQKIFFFADSADLVHFWRWIFSFEDVPESEFFTHCDRAFPKLIFHSSLTFGKFQGAYLERRDIVVHHLGALNDEFLIRYKPAAAAGRLSDVESYFGSLGVGGVSAESVKTRRNAAAMRMRDVEFEGRVVRCEWHTKIKPNIDRIHFSFGDGLDERLLIGIFVDHLPV
jgi:hypothetical protein